MSRPKSIPTQLYTAVVERWTVGQSPGQIAKWLNTSNGRRKLQIRTSRSSVARLLKELVNSQSGQCQVAAINRARMRAPELQARMELVDRKLLDCLDWSAEFDGTAATRSRFSTCLRTLALMSVHTHRQLKAAGTTGADADRALEKWEGVLTGMRDRIQAEELAERAARIEGLSEGQKPSDPAESDSDTPLPANDDSDHRVRALEKREDVPTGMRIGARAEEPAERAARFEGLPEGRTPSESGGSDSDTPLPANDDSDTSQEVTEATPPPLRQTERTWIAGIEVTWEEQVQAGSGPRPERLPARPAPPRMPASC